MIVINDLYSMIITRVRVLLSMHHMSQRELADVLSINRITLNGYLNGRAHIPLHLLILIADYFGVSLDYLCGRKYYSKVSD